jgi:hypothetical protein
LQGDLWRDKRFAKAVRASIGQTDRVTLRDARARARELMASIARGENPNASTASGMTLGDAWEFYKRGPGMDLTPRTIEWYGDHVDRGLRKRKNRPLFELARSEARELHERLTRMAERETTAAIATIRENSEKEFTGLMKEIVEAERRVAAQEFFCDSPVKVLARFGLETEPRSRYLAQLQAAAPAELAPHLGQHAASMKGKALSAAVLSVLDSMLAAERPFMATSLAESLVVADFKQGREALRVARNRTQEAIIAIRSFRAARHSPLSTVRMAVSCLAEDGSIELDNAASVLVNL